jgi:transcriptional regulator of acetoin/glycerol metabolism
MPFVAIECAAIPESLIEAELFGYEEGAFTGARRRGTHGRLLMANGGTLFLDEIGDMPLALQTRLLRVLQERTITPLGGNRSLTIDIAVICATHRDLREMIQQGQFREDLYYRLNGLSVHLPPLRERCDLAVLVARILERECTCGPPPEIAPEVLSLLRQYGWPGNIRQLVNVLRSAAAMATEDGTVRRRHLSDDFLEEVNGRKLPEPAATRAGRRVPTLPDGGADHCRRPLRQVQLDAIRAALEEQGGNVSAAARMLGVSRNTIYRALSSRAE